MNRIVPIILIAIGLSLGFMGFNKLDNSKSSIEIGNLEISAGKKDSSTQAYVMMGVGILLLGGGIIGIGKK